MDDKAEKHSADFSLLMTNASDLMGKKSVRATFKLSAEFIEALSILSAQLGIKQKSLFDHLMEDMESLKTIARQMESSKPQKKDRIQKTFVISKKSLSSLEIVSKTFSAPRDAIVEYSIKRLFPILATERRNQKKREEALSKISDHIKKNEQLLEEVRELVGEEDPVFTSIQEALVSFENACVTIEDFVAKGKRIAEFPVEKLRKN